MTAENYAQHVAQLGTLMGIDDCAPNEDGYCALEIDEEFRVSLQHDAEDDSVILHAEVGEVDPDLEAPAYRMLLEANLIGLGADRATFALNPVTGQVEMTRRFSADAEYALFEKTVEDFINQVDQWRDRLDRQAEIVEPDDTDEDEDAEPADETPGDGAARNPKVVWG
jgi:hypothetical protein